jgi:2-keto-myo-inositol isomerase
MKINIYEITTLRADLEEDCEAYAKANWDAIELSLEKIGRFLKSRSLEDLRALLKRHGLKPVAAIGLAPKGPGLLLARGSDLDAVVTSVEEQIRICEALGAPCLGLGADPTRYLKDGEDWTAGAVENVRKVAGYAQARGVSIGIEALSLSPPVGPFLIESLPETLAFVRRVAHPAVGLNFDSFHFSRSGGQPADLASLAPGEVVHVHICDLPEMKRFDWEDTHRLMPGEGILPLQDVRRVLEKKGYDGYWALELLNEDYWEEPALAVAERGKAAMERFAKGR